MHNPAVPLLETVFYEPQGSTDSDSKDWRALAEQASRETHPQKWLAPTQELSEMIFDRLEGRARQQIEVADVTRQLREKSDDELRFYLEHDRWPEENEIPPHRTGTTPPPKG